MRRKEEHESSPNRRVYSARASWEPPAWLAQKRADSPLERLTLEYPSLECLLLECLSLECLSLECLLPDRPSPECLRVPQLVPLSRRWPESRTEEPRLQKPRHSLTPLRLVPQWWGIRQRVQPGSCLPA